MSEKRGHTPAAPLSPAASSPNGLELLSPMLGSGRLSFSTQSPTTLAAAMAMAAPDSTESGGGGGAGRDVGALLHPLDFAAPQPTATSTATTSTTAAVAEILPAPVAMLPSGATVAAVVAREAAVAAILDEPSSRVPPPLLRAPLLPPPVPPPSLPPRPHSEPLAPTHRRHAALGIAASETSAAGASLCESQHRQLIHRMVPHPAAPVHNAATLTAAHYPRGAELRGQPGGQLTAGAGNAPVSAERCAESQPFSQPQCRQQHDRQPPLAASPLVAAPLKAVGSPPHRTPDGALFPCTFATAPRNPAHPEIAAPMIPPSRAAAVPVLPGARAALLPAATRSPVGVRGLDGGPVAKRPRVMVPEVEEEPTITQV